VVENRLRKEVESLNKKLAEKSEEARALTAKVCKNSCLKCLSQSCRSGSGGSVINWPPGSGSILFIKDWKKFKKKFQYLTTLSFLPI
jgi:hypothetical protein